LLELKYNNLAILEIDYFYSALLALLFFYTLPAEVSMKHFLSVFSSLSIFNHKMPWEAATVRGSSRAAFPAWKLFQ